MEENMSFDIDAPHGWLGAFGSQRRS
jgi:hypothetical protein